MAVEISEEEYQRMRQAVLDQWLIRCAMEAMQTGWYEFDTVDDLMRFLELGSATHEKPRRGKRLP